MMISLRRRRGTFAEVSRLPLFSVVKDHVEDGGKPDNKDFHKFQGVLLKTRSPLLRSRIPDQRPGRKSPPLAPSPKMQDPAKLKIQQNHMKLDCCKTQKLVDQGSAEGMGNLKIKLNSGI